MSALVDIDSLIPYARNARTHSSEQVAQIAASIVEFGFTNPILVDAKGIVAGHGRLAAARLVYSTGNQIKLPSGEAIASGKVPVIDCTGWSDAKRRAYIIADNKLAQNAGWDDALLRLELDDLKHEGFNLDLLGFTAEELMMPNFEPGTEEEQGRLDEKTPTVCPSCGHEF